MKIPFQRSILLFLVILFATCKDSKTTSIYEDPNLKIQVGDIIADPAVDGDFDNCNIGRIPQYYAYKEKPFIHGKLHFENYIRTSYKAPENSKESGLLRIRFTVNCKGESGRFRLLGMNDNYEEYAFSDEIVDQLLQLTKAYKDWRILSHEGFESDYYFYVTFKIKAGNIIEVLP